MRFDAQKNPASLELTPGDDWETGFRRSAVGCDGDGKWSGQGRRRGRRLGRCDPLHRAETALPQRHDHVQNVALLAIDALAQFGDLLLFAVQADFLADGFAQILFDGL